MQRLEFVSISKQSKLKQKIYVKKKLSGRNNTGRTVVYGKGAGNKNQKRYISSFNFYRGILENIEYDPNRSCFLGRVFDIDKKFHFHTLLVNGLEPGSLLTSNYKVKLKIGNRCSLKSIPTGTIISNVEIMPDKYKRQSFLNKVAVAKAAGCFCVLVQKSSDSCLIKLPSGSYKKLGLDSFATVGISANTYHNLKILKKAGKSRWLNRRPKVRGVAKNPVDHPHGGGEGKSSGGRPSVSAWGKIIKK